MSLATQFAFKNVIDDLWEKIEAADRRYAEASIRQLEDDAMESELRRAPWEFLSSVSDHLIARIAENPCDAAIIAAYGVVFGAIFSLFQGETHCQIPLMNVNGTEEYPCSTAALTWCRSCFVPLCEKHIYRANGLAFCSCCCPF